MQPDLWAWGTGPEPPLLPSQPPSAAALPGSRASDSGLLHCRLPRSGAWGTREGWRDGQRLEGAGQRKALPSPPRPPTVSGPSAPHTLPFLLIVDAEWTSWSPWSPCSEPCRGTRTRQRQCHPPQNGGRTCAMLPGDPHGTHQTGEWREGGHKRGSAEGLLVGGLSPQGIRP